MKRFSLGLFAIVILGGGVVFGVLAYAIDGFPVAPAERRAISAEVDGREFNFAVWVSESLLMKASAGLASGASFLDEAAQVQLVRDYAEITGDIRAVERQLDALYAVSDEPQTDSAELQARLRSLRAQKDRLQPVAEGALQLQVDAQLGAAGFELLGGTWPPVAGRMSPLPLMLIISPRDKIEQKYAFALENELSVAERDALEQAIYNSQSLSALVVPIGGLGIFPSMIVETGNLPFLADVYAHEWAHHWLSLKPIGINYAKSGEMRTINETTASLVGEEIGRGVLAAHYPDLLPPPPEPAPVASEDDEESEPDEVAPDYFDFGLEMNETREGVDALISAGQLDEAEAYMEARRQLFVEKGYLIRKLNQAYFAFYSGYATTPGAQGSDPVGPTVVALREQSGSLREFLDRIESVTSFAELEQELSDTEGQP